MTLASTMPADLRPAAAPRLEFLDGLRGLASLYVLLFHIRHFAFLGCTTVPPWLDRLTAFLAFGRYGVDVFIVLSGFCLMLPVAKSVDGQLRGGVRNFVIRRFRRIAPPYYAALMISLVLTVGLGAIVSGRFVSILGAGNLGSHLILLHNVAPTWSMSIDPPMWSVATEWEIYFAFALLLLPVWRRFGMIAVVAIAFAIGVAPHFLLPPDRNLDWACPWFIALFALGMGAAVAVFSANPVARRIRGLPFGWIALALFAALLPVTLWRGADRLGAVASNQPWAIDMWVGLGAAAAITHGSLKPKSPFAARVLSSPAALLFGTFSYSTYLLHQPVLGKFLYELGRLRLSPAIFVISAFILGVPLLLISSYVFHLLFETPFIQKRATGTAAVRRESPLSLTGGAVAAS